MGTNSEIKDDEASTGCATKGIADDRIGEITEVEDVVAGEADGRETTGANTDKSPGRRAGGAATEVDEDGTGTRSAELGTTADGVEDVTCTADSVANVTGTCAIGVVVLEDIGSGSP